MLGVYVSTSNASCLFLVVKLFKDIHVFWNMDLIEHKRRLMQGS